MAHDLTTIIDGKYQIVEKLGFGGFGVVYRAHQLGFDRDIALKVLEAPEVNEALIKRFEREAKILQSFQSRFIPTIYGYGIWDSKPYMAMELVSGMTLASVLQQEGALPLERLKPIVLQVAQALEHAHGKGVTHRDLNPTNILLLTIDGKEEARVIDFGLATFTAPDLRDKQRLTEAGFAMGTFNYMSPEQCLAEPADERSDIYSLGCIIYHALAGRAPFDSENPMLIMRKQVNEVTPNLPPQIPSGVQTVVDTAMAKDPEQRYQSASQLIADWKVCERNSKKRAFKPNLAFIAVCMIVVAAIAMSGFLHPQPSPVVEEGSAQEAVDAAFELDRTIDGYAESERIPIYQKEIPLFEKGLRINARTQELSRRTLDYARDMLACAYRRTGRTHEGFLIALETVLDQEKNQTLDWKAVAELSRNAEESSIADQQKAFEILTPLVNDVSSCPMPARAEALLGLARLDSIQGRFDKAQELLAPLNADNPMGLDSSRIEKEWELLEMRKNQQKQKKQKRPT